MLTVLGGLAEFERELIKAKTGEGPLGRKAQGVAFKKRSMLSGKFSSPPEGLAPYAQCLHLIERRRA